MSAKILRRIVKQNIQQRPKKTDKNEEPWPTTTLTCRKRINCEKDLLAGGSVKGGASWQEFCARRQGPVLATGGRAGILCEEVPPGMNLHRKRFQFFFLKHVFVSNEKQYGLYVYLFRRALWQEPSLFLNVCLLIFRVCLFFRSIKHDKTKH